MASLEEESDSFRAALRAFGDEARRMVTEGWPLLAVIWLAMAFVALGLHAAGLLP